MPVVVAAGGLATAAGTAAVIIAVSGRVAAGTGSRAAGVRAGLLTVILGALMHFVISITALLVANHYTLSDSHDIASYARDHYPDVTSFVIGDALGGGLLGSLMIYPVILLAVALLGAAAGAGRRREALLRG